MKKEPASSFSSIAVNDMKIIKLTEEQEMRVTFAGLSDSDLEQEFGLVYTPYQITFDDFQRGRRVAYAVTDEKRAAFFILKYCG